VSGTVVLLAALAMALQPWTQQQAFSLRLDYPDRLPLHAHIMNVMLDASTCAVLPCDLKAGTVTALMQQCQQALQQRLQLFVPDPAAVLQHHQHSTLGGTHLAGLPPVAMTSLLGVRQAYSIPEVSDPLLGMPSYETACQPDTWLHLQVLEEESALLYNIDLDTRIFPEEVGETVILRLEAILHALARSGDNWQRPPTELIQAEADLADMAAFAAELPRLSSLLKKGHP
jgi:yersiniabactin nonribosomal peptide/polyketide synthase